MSKRALLASSATIALLLAVGLPVVQAGVGAASGVSVSGVSSNGSTVTGWVENQTPHEVRDVRLMVENSFRWTRERSPGEDNPGTGTMVRVPEAIPPGGRLQFRYDMPSPLPQRSDGVFETDVKVVSFSEHWVEQPTASTTTTSRTVVVTP